MINSNLNSVQRAWKKHQGDINVRARMARDEMMTELIRLSKETIVGKRPIVGKTRSGKPIYEKATSGLPPMNRTGKLRGSIRGEKFNIGFANYSAIVGPTIIYGRRVELGGGNWKPGTRFPYMEPAWAKFNATTGPLIIRKYFGTS